MPKPYRLLTEHFRPILFVCCWQLKISRAEAAIRPKQYKIMTKNQLNEYYNHKHIVNEAFRKHIEYLLEKHPFNFKKYPVKSTTDFSTLVKPTTDFENEQALRRKKPDRRKIVQFTLKVGLSNINGDTVNKKQLKIFISELAIITSKAWSLVRESYIGIGYNVDIITEEYLGKSHVKIALKMAGSNPVIEVIDNYGDMAADTWMGGDILFDKNHEITLKLVGKPMIVNPSLDSSSDSSSDSG